ncbi:zinc finger, CCHC-type containing protein [Tanacetum coccineum]
MIHLSFFQQRIQFQVDQKQHELGVVTQFHEKLSSTEPVDCAVCLSKIEEDDEIRVLRCDHLFHKGCLDRCVEYRHTTCPLCRDFLGAGPRMVCELGRELLIFSFCSNGNYSSDVDYGRWWIRFSSVTSIVEFLTDVLLDSIIIAGRWQKKMHFLFTTLKVVYVMTTPMPELMEDDIMEAIRRRAKWENDDYICRGRDGNGLGSGRNGESAKELWDSLESKYMAEDASSKKFLVSNFNNYEMVDSSHLRIEESLRAHDSDKGKGKEVVGPIVNMTKESARLVTSRGIAIVVDAIAWWIDYGATTHVCKDRCWFKTYEPAEDGYGSGKSITLFNVLYVPKLRIIHETTAPYTPQQNGVDERKNRDLKEMVNSMLSYSGLSEGFWGEAMAVVRLSDPKRKTLGEKGIDCIFVGYAEHFKAYRFYVIVPNDCVSINTDIELRDAIFNENRFSSIHRAKDIIPNSDESQRDDHSNDVPSETPKPRKAMQSRDVAFWKDAIDDEIGLTMENNTWVLSDLPPGCKPLGCKWIFKRKIKVDRTVDKFKARLVFKGFRQKKGIDYFDTYAPVARITTIRLLLALAAIHNLVIHQMDVKIAFLNGDLEEEVYMKQPKGFIMLDNEHKYSHGSDRKLMPTGKPVDQLKYSRAISCLMYAMMSTRPDIAYVVGRLSRFTSNPKGYSDASWINPVEDSSSTSGWFVASAAAGKESEWLRNLIHEIPIWPKPIAPISIHCDSAATLAKSYSQIYNGKSRHLGVRHSMIRELIMNGVISIEFVRSQHNLDDHLTKGLTRDLASSKSILWEYISVLLARWNGEAIVMGDFNEVHSSDERRGSCFNPYSARRFDRFILTSGLVDIKLKGYTFTWSYPSASKMSKLDRFLVSDGFKLLGVDKRFLSMESKRDIINELGVIDKDLDSGLVLETNILRRLELKRKLLNINDMESKDNIQKSKVTWAIEGDENSKFFHGIINKKRSQLAIRGIFVDGFCCIDPGMIKKAFFNHFAARFNEPGTHRFKINFQFPKKLVQSQADELERVVSRDEIRLAVWNCGDNKSSGPDGYSFEFFKKYLDLIGSDLCEAV